MLLLGSLTSLQGRRSGVTRAVDGMQRERMERRKAESGVAAVPASQSDSGMWKNARDDANGGATIIERRRRRLAPPLKFNFVHSEQRTLKGD